MQVGEVAERLSKADNTIRNWTREFTTYLSADLVERPEGADREYAEEDLYVLATIAEESDKGRKYPQIHEALQRGRRVVELPPPKDPAAEEAKKKIDLVPVQDVYLEQKDKQSLQLELERLVMQQQRELERALVLHKEEVDRLAAAHQDEVGRLKGERDRADQDARTAATQRLEAEIKSARMEERLNAAAQALAGLQSLQQELQKKSEEVGEFRAGNWELKQQLQAQQQYIEHLQKELEQQKQQKGGWFRPK